MELFKSLYRLEPSFLTNVPFSIITLHLVFLLNRIVSCMTVCVYHINGSVYRNGNLSGQEKQGQVYMT